MEHVQRLLNDERLRVDTTLGSRPVSSFKHDIKTDDATVDLKRTMAEMGKPDRQLQERMPQGQTLDVTLKRSMYLGLINKSVGQIRVICMSQVRSILAGQPPDRVRGQQLQKLLSSTGPGSSLPTTIVVMSTSGFSIDAHDLAERGANRTVILVEPNSANGWDVHGPQETKATVDLFDPEADEEKRSRIVSMIEAQAADLTGSGIASDKLAAKAQLPVPFVESALKEYTRSHPGLVAKRLDGRMVLFRQGQAPVGGSAMPLLDRMKSLFSRKGETEKKVALLSERRAVLSQQRDRAYEEMGALEQREAGLKTEFAQAGNETSKRRITTQILQLRKELDRRHQLISVLNQQVEVVSTHLHNLQLLQQGQTAKLPENEEILEDASKAEEMLAELQANVEITTGASTTVATGLSAEEQALYDELQGLADRNDPAAGGRIESPAANRPVTQNQATPKRAEPEAG